MPCNPIFSLTAPIAPGYQLDACADEGALALLLHRRRPRFEDWDRRARATGPEALAVIARVAREHAVEHAGYWCSLGIEAPNHSGAPAAEGGGISGDVAAASPAERRDDCTAELGGGGGGGGVLSRLNEKECTPVKGSESRVADDAQVPGRRTVAHELSEPGRMEGGAHGGRPADTPSVARILQSLGMLPLQRGGGGGGEGAEVLIGVASTTEGDAEALLRHYRQQQEHHPHSQGMCVRLPDPRRVSDTFYPLRHIALRDRGYVPGVGGVRSTVLAVDKPRTRGAKQYQVLATAHVYPFISQVLDVESRNFYVLVDPVAPLDAFFDIDGFLLDEVADYSSCSDNSGLSYSVASWVPTELLAEEPPTVQKSATRAADPSTTATTTISAEAADELQQRVLLVLLQEIVRELEAYFTEYTELSDASTATPRAAVEKIAVFSSSSQVTSPTVAPGGSQHGGKISFHIHARMAGGVCFSNLAELRAFVHGRLLGRKYERLAREEAVEGAPRVMRSEEAVEEAPRVMRSEEAVEEAPPTSLVANSVGAAERWQDVLLERVIDDSIYTQWRPFRLPFNCKGYRDASPVGSVVARRPHLLESPAVVWRQLRVLLPFAAPTPTSSSGPWVAELRALLERYAPGERGDVAAVERAGLGALLAEYTAALEGELGDGDSGEAGIVAAAAAARALEHFSIEALQMALIARTVADAPGLKTPAAAAAAQEDGRPFAPAGPCDLPPMPSSGVRQRVTSPALLHALKEIFVALHPEYAEAFAVAEAPAGGLSRLGSSAFSAQFEDNGRFRSYYVFQKLCKYCVKAGRFHKATYGQLFITYQSVKYRCYSNDCHTRCLVAYTFPPHSCPGAGGAPSPPAPPAAPPVPDAAPLSAHDLHMLRLRTQLFPELSEAELQRRYHLRNPSMDTEVLGDGERMGENAPS